MCVCVFSMVMCFENHFSQIEQEMSLVICKCDVKSKFLSKWKMYVLAILQYAEKSRKKSISNKLADMDGDGNIVYAVIPHTSNCTEVQALHALCMCGTAN